MSRPSDAPHGEPLPIGCRRQMLLLSTFVLLFLATCWLVGTAIATSS